MTEICDEQNEANAKRMQQPDQRDALAGRIVPHQGDAAKGEARIKENSNVEQDSLPRP